ncbi:hypothetical protein VZT92_019019 [Zoarces viviparus]|uniref:Uncharacterized protein n=1 Tax=Zoarces viviparus TaxID=48416 RepID=A0AAW1EJV8_ZOAVI
MHPLKVMMVETVILKLLHHVDRIKMVTPTDRERRQSADTACSADISHLTVLPPPTHKGEALLFLQVSGDAQVEPFGCRRWSGPSREKSTPASVSLRIAFSLSMVER